MRQTLIRGSVLCLGLLWQLQAAALDIAGVQVPDSIPGDGNQKRMSLAGHAEVHRRYLPFYGVVLHLPEPRPRSAVLVQGLAACRITLVWYANELSAEQVRAYFGERFSGAADDEVLTRAQPRIDQLLAALPKVDRGSVFSFDYDPDRGMRVDIDGKPVVALPGVEFNRVLLSLWLGPAAEDGVARALLAEAS